MEPNLVRFSNAGVTFLQSHPEWALFGHKNINTILGARNERLDSPTLPSPSAYPIMARTFTF